MEERIRKAVSEALVQMGTGNTTFVVERPSDMSHGDYTTNAALAAAKALGKKPHEIADELARFLIDALGKDVASHVAVAGPGFVNITLAREAVTLAVAEADAKGEVWGKGSLNAGQRVLIEYTDPNPFKEMHIGHLMSNVIGEALSRLIENDGAKVIRANYQGDVGPHVAKAIWGMMYVLKNRPDDSETLARKLQYIGNAYSTGAGAYDNEDLSGNISGGPTKEELKKQVDEINRKLYDKSDTGINALYEWGRKVTLDAFEEIYKILGTKFDYYFFESETAESGMRIVRDGLAKGIFEESEGAVIYRGEKKGLHTLVFITSKGTPTYEAKDMGLAFLKEERVQSDRSIIVTAAEQIGHFKVFFAALSEIAPLLAQKTEHVSHGLLRLTSGKMSSRAGNVITASDFIKEVIEKASQKNEDPLIAEQVALGAIKYMILRQAPGSDIIFDEEKSLSLEGDSGPYLQYALVRARKILTYAEGAGNGTLEPEASYDIERIILHFPEVVARASRELAPNLLVAYLTELAGTWNAFYATEQILGSPEEAYKQRVARAFANTMINGLTLLGIPAPEKM